MAKMQARAPAGTNRSFRLNPSDLDNLDYLLETWGADDPKLTPNGVVRKSLETTARAERARRIR